MAMHSEAVMLADDQAKAYWSARIDLDALLAALVLVPNSYPRNRFFGLYRWSAARRVRRRAARLRSIIHDLAGTVESVQLSTSSANGSTMSYFMADVTATRRVILDGREAALLKFAVGRRRQRPSRDGSLEAALARIGATNVAEVQSLLSRLMRVGSSDSD